MDNKRIEHILDCIESKNELIKFYENKCTFLDKEGNYFISDVGLQIIYVLGKEIEYLRLELQNCLWY